MVGVSNYFVVNYKCKYCGRPYKDSFVTWDELLDKGIDNDYIEEACNTYVYMDNKYQLEQIKKNKMK